MKHIIKRIKELIIGIYSYNILSKNNILPPKRLLLVLTYRCNSRCIMCNIWKMKPKKEMSLNQWKKILEDPMFQHIEKINITGGEALLSPNCIPIIELLVRNIPKLSYIDIVSNGFATELIRKKVQSMLTICKKNNIIFSISISLDGIGMKHEELRGIPNAYNLVMASILKLKELQKQYPFSIVVGSVLMKQTVSEIEKLQAWSKQNNIPQCFQVVGFHDTYVDNLNKQKDIIFSKQNNKKILRLFETLGKPKNWKDIISYFWKDMYFMYKYQVPRSTPCPFLYDEFAIDALGNVFYCLSEHGIGNIKDTTSVSPVSDLYFDPKNIQYRNYIKTHCCPTCNSECNVRKAIAYDFKKYIWLLITGTPWYGISFHIKQLKQHIRKALP